MAIFNSKLLNYQRVLGGAAQPRAARAAKLAQPKLQQ